MERIVKLLELNGEQTDILRCGAERIAVSAGAGTGKTRVLAARFLLELESGGANTESIAAITFTENAADELKERLQKSVNQYINRFGERGSLNGETADGIVTAQISTIHGLAARIVRENLSATNFPAGFEIADSADHEAAVQKAAVETVLGLHGKKGRVAKALQRLLETELFNLDRVTENIAEIVKQCAAGHLTAPLKSPVSPDGEANTQKVRKLLRDSEQVFSSSKAVRKRFEKALKMADGSPSAGIECKNLQGTAKEMEAVASMKTSAAEEKSAALEIAGAANRAADGLNARLTSLYLPVAEEAIKRHEEIKAETAQIGYDDLLTNALSILETNKAALLRYQKLFKLIMVDEFQDTDPSQERIISLLSKGGKLIVVGDPLQSIYGFRRAEPELFEKILRSPGFKTFRLDTNYRASSGLTGILNGFFENVFGGCEKMKPSGKPDGMLETFAAASGKAEETRRSEAGYIARKISELTNGGALSYSDIALIFRRKTSMPTYERALRRCGLPYKRAGDDNFFSLPEIRDIVSMMRFISNPADETAQAAVLRSPFFGISDSGLARYFREKSLSCSGCFSDFLEEVSRGKEEWNLAGKYLLCVLEGGRETDFSSAFEVARFAVFGLGYAAGARALEGGQRIRANIIRFTEMCSEMSSKGTGLAEAVSRFDLLKQSRQHFDDGVDENSVTLTTGHGAKGLEFPVVFVADTNYSPPINSGSVAVSRNHGVIVRHDRCSFGGWKNYPESEYGEEKRILYVTLTRAEDAVFVCRHEKPRVGSFAAIVQSGMEKMADFDGAAGQMPDRKKKHSPADAMRIQTQEIAAQGFKPVCEKQPEAQPADRFRTVSKSEEGEMLHRFFELWDFLPDSVEQLAGFVMAEKFVSEKSVRDQITSCSKNALQSPLAKMFRSAKKIRREHEFTIKTASETINGRIDLLMECGGRVVLVDYKHTDFFEEGKYAEQIDIYRNAVENIYGKKPDRSYICVLPSVELKTV